MAEPNVGHNGGMVVWARALGAVGGVLAATLMLSGCVTTVSGDAVRDAKTVPTNVPRLAESDIDKVIIPIDRVNAIMGTTDLEVTSDIDDMTDSEDKVSDPDCLGAMFGAEEAVYKGSGWTAVRDVVAREPEADNDHWVEQTVVVYPNERNAKRFFEKSRSTWQKCAGTSLAVDTENTSSLWEFDDVDSGAGMITQMTIQEDADGWGCQHALAVASNITVETWACGYGVSQEAATMAIDIMDTAAAK
ncbi:sensor domain-containing protein [Mycolicibacterium agri]|nr:sensor domain-containing protein [Mycolicibacterium agri]GFG50892.1 sensor domain-containing protein [Mycolicibacterium agri]